MRLPTCIKKAGDTKSDDVAKALLGMTFDTRCPSDGLPLEDRLLSPR
jgi:hypothetical protein